MFIFKNVPRAPQKLREKEFKSNICLTFTQRAHRFKSTSILHRSYDDTSSSKFRQISSSFHIRFGCNFTD